MTSDQVNQPHINTTSSISAQGSGDFLNAGRDSWLVPLNSTVFVDGLLSSLTVTVLSELGDRTFFIAAILAVKHARVVVFFGQMFAQTAMTIISVALGLTTHFIPRYVVHYLSIVLFILFGCKMLYDVRGLFFGTKAETAEPFHAVVEDDVETQNNHRRHWRWKSSGFISALTMTLVTECGDRSQMATILLAATRDTYAVTLGTLLGHALCTTIAVIAGRAIAAYIPVRILTLIGALIFFAFAIAALIGSDDGVHDALSLNSTDNASTAFPPSAFVSRQTSVLANMSML